MSPCVFMEGNVGRVMMKEPMAGHRAVARFFARLIWSLAYLVDTSYF